MQWSTLHVPFSQNTSLTASPLQLVYWVTVIAGPKWLIYWRLVNCSEEHCNTLVKYQIGQPILCRIAHYLRQPSRTPGYVMAISLTIVMGSAAPKCVKHSTLNRRVLCIDQPNMQECHGYLFTERPLQFHIPGIYIRCPLTITINCICAVDWVTLNHNFDNVLKKAVFFILKTVKVFKENW